MQLLHQLLSPPSLSLLMAALGLLQLASSQQDFTTLQVPTFNVGVFYPGRSNIAATAEVMTCRAITDRIDRNSARFNSELVTNTNNGINFANSDSRIMSSRMQSRLDDLAQAYFNRFGRRMLVLKAWTPFPDPDLVSEPESLHYEGRTVRVRLPRTQDYPTFLELAVGASAFDWVYYQAQNFVRLSVIPSNCVRNVDCVFLLDRSGSVGRTNHNIALQFINSVISFFNIASDASRVGMAAYSSSSSIQFDLDDHSSVTSLQNAVSNVRFTGGSTNTPAALDHARLLLNPAANRGARPNSDGIPKIAILITDGRSNRGNLQAAAPALRNSGVQVYALGIGNIDVNELRLISSDPDDEHVFILSSFLDAAGFVDFLSVTTCDTPAIIDPGDNVTVPVPDGGIRYFQTECPAFSDKVLVELIDINGMSFLYCSTMITNPGPLTPSTSINDTAGITRRTVGLFFLPNQDRVVYIGVQGQGSMDSFTLIVWDQLFEPVDAFINVIEGVTGVIYDVQNNLTLAALQNTYQYSIIEGNEAGIFSINSNNGQVRIPSSSPGVNFGTRQTHNLTVQAQNVVEDCQRARIRINIVVVRNRIEFNTLAQQSVPEDATVGAEIVSVVATGGIGPIRYSITGGNVNGAFAINRDNGLVTVAASLDFETRTTYTLSVRAESQETMVSDTTTLGISVLDVNEEHMFVTSCARSSAGCSFNIDENQDGTILGRIVVSDPDSSSSPNGSHFYTISNINFPFSVNDMGDVRTSGMLDREMRDSYSFTLTVRDRCVGGCTFSIQTNIVVTVNDLNDNPPVFTLNPATVEVAEDASQNTVVAQYIATDADIGSNAEISFSLSPTNFPFTLSSTGILTLTGAIDFETRQTYPITVTASNPDGLSTSTNTTIQVININDNAPMFVGLPYSDAVVENSAEGTPVRQVMATDADLGIHGQIRYFITGGNFNNSFQISSTNGMISVLSNIDREAITSFDLVVQARDRGTPQRKTATTTIPITVTDVNDNPPIFEPDLYPVFLREDLAVNEDVVQVTASDADEPGNPNSQIEYSISSGNSEGRFRIDSSNGLIEIDSMLDFETTPSYSLVIVGQDRGVPTMSGSAVVEITVINVNENPPTLTGDQEEDVSEAAPINTLVAVFQALDPDQMPVTFSITGGNSEGRFMIGPTSGEIRLVSMLDFETTTRYVLNIRASDGQQSAEAILTVNVLDENEFSPEFSGPAAFSILEEEAGGLLVGTVMATDGDRDAIVTYSFQQQDSTTNLFTLDSESGQIRTRERLDREVLTQIFLLPSSVATVQISARDNGSPSRFTTRTFSITLVDINDNSPVFSDSSYSNMLMENLPGGQEVFPSSATDADLNNNAVISYSYMLLDNTGNDPFTIDTSTGVITTTTPLDCEEQSFYQFRITAEDMGTPNRRSSTVDGNLTIIDENDNPPIFDLPLYRMTVLEDASPNSEVLTVRATDRDKGENGEVEYTIVSDFDFTVSLETSVEMTFFTVGLQDGILRNVNEFDFETAPQINLTIFANDRGLPQLSSSTLVILDIQNVDERAPIFTSRSCSTEVSEDLPVGEEVVQCLAEDFDTTATPGQDPIVYSFVTPSSVFAIDPITAVITTLVPLDREMGGLLSVRVRATDLAGRSSVRRVAIRLLDVNDNAPQFPNAPHSFFFTNSGVVMLQDFLTVAAMDPDNQENGTFSFSLGSVQKLPSNMETRIEVVATDNGSPVLSNSTTVTVTFQRSCQLQEYFIAPITGVLSVSLLCSVTVTPTQLPLLLLETSNLDCTFVSNTPVSYQFLHNSTAITSSMTADNRITSTVQLAIRVTSFNNAGEYACRVTSLAGSLQTPGVDAFLLVSPTITTLPQNTAAPLGATATLSCAAVGIPPPTVEWYLGEEQVGDDRVLSVENVDGNDAGTYTCSVSNEAGDTEMSAELTIYDAFNVVDLELSGIDNPSEDGTCQHFDPKALEMTIGDLTNQKIMVTDIQDDGAALCEMSACSPSPCMNGGTCATSETVEGGYICECRQGYAGKDCTMDVNECDQDPCGTEGQCTNVLGSFSCSCNAGSTGRRCQLTDVCSTQDPCSEGEICVEVFTASGYKCIVPDQNSSLAVGGASLSAGELNDLIQFFIEQELARGNTRRRKRQTSRLITICEPRFVTLDSNTLLLIWLCPEGEEVPSSEAQQLLCTYLFELGVVDRCKLPSGDFMTPPTIPPPPSASITVTVIVVDSATNQPIDALDSVEVLRESGVQEELTRSGLEVTAITAQVMEPRPEDPEEQGGAGGVIGGVIGALLGVVLVSLAVMAVVVGIKAKEHKKKQNRKQVQALQMASLENGDTEIQQSTSKGSLDNLLEDDELPPKRPPKPASPVASPADDEDESIYQNVTVTPEAKSIQNSDVLESVDVGDNDYDILPPKKN